MWASDIEDYHHRNESIPKSVIIIILAAVFALLWSTTAEASAWEDTATIIKVEHLEQETVEADAAAINPMTGQHDPGAVIPENWSVQVVTPENEVRELMISEACYEELLGREHAGRHEVSHEYLTRECGRDGKPVLG